MAAPDNQVSRLRLSHPLETFHALVQLAGAGKWILQPRHTINLLHEMGAVWLGARTAAVFAGCVEDGDAFCQAHQTSFGKHCGGLGHELVAVVLCHKYTEGYAA